MKAALSGRTRLAVLTLVVLAAAAAGIAYAAIPDAGGVVHGCYAKRDGTLRVIDTEQGGSCNASKETTLDWNRTGPQGPAGPQGATGPQGPAGPRGPGASTVQVNAPVGQETVLTTLPDGIELRGNCFRTRSYSAIASTYFCCR